MNSNKNLTEKEYYTVKKNTTNWTQAEFDIRGGTLRIYDVPFEYRSLPLYRRAYEKCFYDSKWNHSQSGIGEECLMFADQIMEDIKECESRYQKSGNLSKEYPWYLLKARTYCLKRMLMEGVIEGLFEKEIIPPCLISDIPQNKNRDFEEITAVEKNYYLKTGSKGTKQANLDILNGEVKIYDVPVKFRYNSLYVMAYRYIRQAVPVNIQVEKELLKKTMLDDIEEFRMKFWKEGNLSSGYPFPRLNDREVMLKLFYNRNVLWNFF